MSAEVFPAIARDGAGSLAVVDRIDDEQRVETGNVIDEIECRRAQIFQIYIFLKGVAGLELMKDVGTHSVIAEEDIADARDQYPLHNTFTSAIRLPSGSKVWQAHAMQGSKEWIVRTTSSHHFLPCTVLDTMMRLPQRICRGGNRK